MTLDPAARMSRKSRGHARRPHPEPLESRQLLTAGAMDTSFGSGGFLYPAGDRAQDVLILPGGDILAVGYGYGAGKTASLDFQVTRTKPNGALDTAFGSGGTALADFNKGHDRAWTAALQVVNGQARILVGGTATAYSGSSAYDVDALARFNLNGTLDTTFGTGGKTGGTGKVTTSGASGVLDMVVLPNDGSPNANKIVTVGSTGNDLRLARYNANGTLDTTFGAGGLVTVDQSGAGLRDGGRRVALQSDGKIVVVGWAHDPAYVVEGASGSNTRTVLSRFNANGSSDASFGTNGRVLSEAFMTSSSTTDPKARTVDPTVTLQTVGGQERIVVGGATNYGWYTGSSIDMMLERYNPGGSLDTTFGSGGRTRLDPGLAGGGAEADDYIYGLAVQPDAKIVAVGQAGMFYAAARLDATGMPDNSFGAGGAAVLDTRNIGGIRRFNAAALQANGAVAAVGFHAANPQGSFVVARLQGDPSLMAAAVAPGSLKLAALDARRVRPALDEALARWRAAGADISGLHDIAIEVADLPGRRLAYAGGRTITLDADAAGWGWAVGREARRGRATATGRMDLLRALEHEVGHLLGRDHPEGRVMAATLAPGPRQPSAVRVNVGPVGVAASTPSRLAIEAFQARIRRPRTASRA